MYIADVFSESELRAFGAEIPFSFRAHTTIGVGGDAEAALYPATAEGFSFAVSRLRSAGIAFLVLGKGSNVLASDAGYRGVVLRTDRMRSLTLTEQGILAQCGVGVGSLLRFAAENGRGGLHFLAGIPASVGGAAFMNAGACGRYIGETIRCVTALCGENAHLFSSDECAFSYKHSLFMEQPFYILSVEFMTESGEKKSILRDIDRVICARDRLPRGKSMGCVFKNPPDVSAGTLIEQAGLKGASVGDAVVAQEHANFILNRGKASAAQIRELIETIRMRVYAVSGVRLEEEIRYIGEF